MTSILRPDWSFFILGRKVSSPVIFANVAVTDANGMARIYLTIDGNVGGTPVFRTVYGANIGVEHTNPVFYNQTVSGTSYVEVHVRQQVFGTTTILGIPVINSVNMQDVVGATVKFTVIGD